VRIRTTVLLCVAAFLFVTLAIARSRDRQPDEQKAGARNRSTDTYRQRSWRSRRIPSRGEFPTWEIQPEFKADVFTFVRVQYDADGPFGWWDRWDNDYPDGDWNFSFRLQQLTSLRVAPDGKVLRLTDPELCNYPFIYMAGVHWMKLSLAEQAALRRYLLNGGFVMMDDFWSPEAWANVLSEMQGVLPDQEPRELSLDHDIFHMVYDLKELPQVVDIRTWREGYGFEHWHGQSDGDESPHFWAYFDDRGRMMALLCHNNDLGDGWEREGENEEYFHQFSEKKSYPMGINVVIYAMSH
jgi:hypothetical protein